MCQGLSTVPTSPEKTVSLLKEETHMETQRRPEDSAKHRAHSIEEKFILIREFQVGEILKEFKDTE